METDLSLPEAAERYSAELNKTFAISPEELPRFDLMLLGLGADGHIASLFPGDDLTGVSGRLVVASLRERQGHRRLSLTMPAINNSACVAILVTGKEKANMLRQVLPGSAGAESEGGRSRYLLSRWLRTTGIWCGSWMAPRPRADHASVPVRAAQSRSNSASRCNPVQ